MLKWELCKERRELPSHPVWLLVPYELLDASWHGKLKKNLRFSKMKKSKVEDPLSSRKITNFRSVVGSNLALVGKVIGHVGTQS